MEKITPRKIFLSEQFNQDTIKHIISSIININDRDDHLEKEAKLYYDMEYKRKPIELYIDSYGGSVYQCLGLISVMEKSKTPIHTIVTGCAMSCGFILLIHGHKRFAHKLSTVLYHQVSSNTWGTIKGMEEKVEETKRLNDIVADLTFSKTKISKKKLNDVYEKKIDWYINADEAKKLGIIDEVL